MAESQILLTKEKAQECCDTWAALLKIGSWNFTVELYDTLVCHDSNIKNVTSQFRYDCQNGTVVLEILYKEATEERIISMLVDFSLIHQLLPRLIEGGDQYLDHDDRNIKNIVGALLELKYREDKH